MDTHIGAHIELREEFCIETRPCPSGVTIFGGSGDLAHRKLIPSLFSLYTKGLLADEFYLCGCLSYGDSPVDDESFRRAVEISLENAAPDADAGAVRSFISRSYYAPGDVSDPETYRKLGARLRELDSKYETGCNHVFYMAVPPALYPSIVTRLAQAGLNRTMCTDGKPRVVVEKPFGRDLASAHELTATLKEHLGEDQIFRIDHYLGKETVQNILMLRFANAIFEPIWNSAHIDHIQITAAETLGVEHRAGYYEEAGCLRDMFQNHMLQMLALVAMEPPSSFEADLYRDEKVKLFRAIRPLPTHPARLAEVVARGRYAAGEIAGQPVVGYRDDLGVAPDSNTETFVAMKLMVDNWRWAGVPFYLRSGKRLGRRVSEIAVTFKHMPHSIFPGIPNYALTPNVLVMNVQPEEGISLTLEAKRPGPKACMGAMTLSVGYREVFGVEPPEAYERLLLDCMLGDQSLFVRTDGMERAWELLTPLLDAWSREDAREPEPYTSGSWGPKGADELIQRDGHYWRTP